MLLTPQSARHRLRRERRLFVGLLAFISILLITLFVVDAPSLGQASGPDLIQCNAERLQGRRFVQGDYRFGGGEWQSREQARSGRFSLRLPQQPTAAFGFSIDLENVLPGEVYELSVWRYGDPEGRAKLAVQGREPQGFYQESGQEQRRDEEGWSLLQLRFHVPFQQSPTQLGVYVYSDGSFPVYFDDLEIRKVDLWQESDFQPSKIHLELSRSALEELAAKRDEALQKGLLESSEDDWVEGRIQGEGEEEIPIELRLKGDWLDHLRGDKWSFRIKVKNPYTWRRLTVFSLHTPAARYHLHEWLLHQWWRQEDVLTTRYDFVELIINGESRGIYAYEEHFEKQLVESQERREGPIIRLAEDGFWAGMARQLQHHGFIRPGSGHSVQEPANAVVEAFNEADLLSDTVLSKQLSQARLLLEQFRAGQVPPAEIFDLDRLASYYAICDLLNAYHGVVWHNQRFYYNPISGRLEPIGFDGFGDHAPPRYDFLLEGALHPDSRRTESLYGLLLQDTAFVSHYIAALDRLSEPERWQSFWRSAEAAWTARLQWLQLEFPAYQPSPEEMQQEIAFVRSHLLPFGGNSLRSYSRGNGELLVTNTHSLPIKLLGYGGSPEFMSKSWPEARWLPGQPPRKLWSRLDRDSVIYSFASIHFVGQQALADQAVPHFEVVSVPASARYLFFQLPGKDTLLTAPIRRLPLPEGLTVAQQYRSPSRPEDFPDFFWDGQVIRIPKGTYALRNDLIIGKDQELWLEQGARLDLLNGAAIISYGPVSAYGAADDPVVISSSDGSGQGLQVLEAGRASVLHNVLFQNLRALQRGDWQLTGAVTFYGSSVELEDCVFQDNKSEDALNLVRAEFQMSGCIIRRTSSDGFDADFCKGVIRNSQFEDTTNDGLDFSGSIISVENSRMENCGDKGVSVGEESDVSMSDCEVVSAPIGLAAKDLSTLYIRKVRIRDCVTGLAAFQKKPEFGPALIIAEQLEFENNDRQYQIAPGSRLQLDDQLIDQ